MDVASVGMVFGVGLMAAGAVRLVRHVLLRRVGLRRLHMYCG